MYLKKLHQFDIDCNRLELEWKQVSFNLSNLQDSFMPFYNRINITYSNLQDKTSLVIETGQRTHYPNESFSISNIVEPFKNTYTEQVLHLVNNWFSEKNLRITKAKYAALESKQIVGTHTDKDYKIRYHIPILSADSCTMTINGISQPINEVGCIYSMPGMLPHSAENMSDHLRLLLSLDIAKI